MKPEDEAAFKIACSDTEGCSDRFRLGFAHGFKAALEYRDAQPAVAMNLTDVQIELGAKKLAELFDYPWDSMPDKGKHEMRGHIQSVFEVIAAEAARAQ